VWAWIEAQADALRADLARWFFIKRRLNMYVRCSLAILAAALIATAQTTTVTPAQAQGYGRDCEHGPDTYRVRNVSSWDRLNIRSGPSSRRVIVGTIPATGTGIHCLGPCEGNWCRVSWRGIVGWTNMRFLGE